MSFSSCFSLHSWKGVGQGSYWRRPKIALSIQQTSSPLSAAQASKPTFQSLKHGLEHLVGVVADLVDTDNSILGMPLQPTAVRGVGLRARLCLPYDVMTLLMGIPCAGQGTP